MSIKKEDILWVEDRQYVDAEDYGALEQKLKVIEERCEQMIRGGEITSALSQSTKEFNQSQGALAAYRDILKILKSGGR